jgi:putative ABC transport system substrate-binding protein
MLSMKRGAGPLPAHAHASHRTGRPRQGQQMKRREFTVLLSGVAAAWTFEANAQRAQQKRLIGVLQDLAEDELIAKSEVIALRETLAKLGWTEGNNLHIEVGWGAGDPDRIQELAKVLVGLKPDAIIARGTPATRALARETRTIPIVFVVVADPLGAGFAESLAHPGRNITGFSNLFSTLAAKWVELLKEIAPQTEHVALLFNPKTLAPLELFMPSIQAAASTLGIRVSTSPIQATGEIEDVFVALARDSGSALIVMPDGFNLANREAIVATASRFRVPAIYFNAAFFANLGGLITYGPDFTEYYRLAAGYIDLILKGRRPEDLPIQQPTNFQLVINLKTAKALGLNISPSLLATADQVIE